MLETAQRMMVTTLAATPPAIAFVAVMTKSFRRLTTEPRSAGIRLEVTTSQQVNE